MAPAPSRRLNPPAPHPVPPDQAAPRLPYSSPLASISQRPAQLVTPPPTIPPAPCGGAAPASPAHPREVLGPVKSGLTGTGFETQQQQERKDELQEQSLRPRHPPRPKPIENDNPYVRSVAANSSVGVNYRMPATTFHTPAPKRLWQEMVLTDEDTLVADQTLQQEQLKPDHKRQKISSPWAPGASPIALDNNSTLLGRPSIGYSPSVSPFWTPLSPLADKGRGLNYDGSAAAVERVRSRAQPPLAVWSARLGNDAQSSENPGSWQRTVLGPHSSTSPSSLSASAAVEAAATQAPQLEPEANPESVLVHDGRGHEELEGTSPFATIPSLGNQSMIQSNDDDTREPIDTEEHEDSFPDVELNPVQESKPADSQPATKPSLASETRFEPKAASWVSDLPDQVIESALASCDTASYLNDDVINTALGLLCSLHPHLRTLSSLEMARPGALQPAVDRILPRYGGARENAAKTPTANQLTSDNLLDGLVLVVGFQPVSSHWALAWIDINARTASIYDSMPSEDGRQTAGRVVRELIAMLPAPRQDGAEGIIGSDSAGVSASASASAWKVAFPAFPRQTDGYSCGIFALAAAFHLAAGQDPPRPSESLDTELWRLFCKALLATSPPVGGSTQSPLLGYVPALDDSVKPLESVPPAPLTPKSYPARAGGGVRGGERWGGAGSTSPGDERLSLSALRTAQEYLDTLKRSAAQEFRARAAHAEGLKPCVQHLHGLLQRLLPEAGDADIIQSDVAAYIKVLEGDAGRISAALSQLQSIESPSLAVSGCIATLPSECEMLRRRAKAAWQRLGLLQLALHRFVAARDALATVESSLDGLVASYDGLIKESSSVD